MYHSFLQASPPDEACLSAAGEGGDLEDVAYNEAKNDRIRFFASAKIPVSSSSSFLRQTREDQSMENSNHPMNKSTTLHGTSPPTTSRKGSLSPPNFPCVVGSPHLVAGLNLADVFIPAHLAVAEISSVHPDPNVGSQLEVTFAIPRPVGVLGAVPEEEEVVAKVLYSLVPCSFCI